MIAPETKKNQVNDCLVHSALLSGVGTSRPLWPLGVHHCLIGWTVSHAAWSNEDRDTHFARVSKCEPAAGSSRWPVAEKR